MVILDRDLSPQVIGTGKKCHLHAFVEIPAGIFFVAETQMGSLNPTGNFPLPSLYTTVGRCCAISDQARQREEKILYIFLKIYIFNIDLKNLYRKEKSFKNSPSIIFYLSRFILKLNQQIINIRKQRQQIAKTNNLDQNSQCRQVHALLGRTKLHTSHYACKRSAW